MNSYTNRVLCVEDHTASCDLIRFILQREGCDVVTATDFMEGLSKISQESFDLYLLDQCLPTGEGTDLCQKVHASDPHVPVIIYSADVRDATRQHALEAGAAKFLDKPIDPFVLSGVVKDQLEKSKLRSFDAKMEEITAIRDEIASCLQKAEASLGRAKEGALQVEKSLLQIKAFQTFIAAGGTKAAFDRMWPEVWNAEVVEKEFDFSD